MYHLLPSAVARDQQGVGDAVAAHFATAHAWDAVLKARVSIALLASCFDPPPLCQRIVHLGECGTVACAR
jgi:hypothetical protein